MKLTDVPKVTPSIRSAIENLELDRLDLVYPGPNAYSLGEKVLALPLRELLGGAHPPGVPHHPSGSKQGDPRRAVGEQHLGGGPDGLVVVLRGGGYGRYTHAVAIPLTGMVHGNTVTLDAPVPPLEGKRVLVLLEPTDEPPVSAKEHASAWERWLTVGPQGPIEDDAEIDFP